MNHSKNILLVALGLAIGILVGVLFTQANSSSEVSEASEEDNPLYWVAPMDAEYRRDKPGKSPMGMDLVPVYATQQNDDNENAIYISPHVVNNLGVTTAKVKFDKLNPKIKTVGYVQYDEDRLIHIHPRVGGWIEKLYIKTTGAPVTKGEPIYAIYSPQLVNAQDELLLALQRNNKSLIRASEDRLSALQVPKKTIANIKKSKKASQTITFYAPDDGVVDNLNIREGFYVKPGTTLMSIGNLNEIWVIAEVFERQAAEVKIGDKVTMKLDYMKQRSWQGTVDFIYPVLDLKTRTARVRLRFENNDWVLKPNMFAQIVITQSNQTASLLVPNQAVIRTGSMDRVVLALGDGYFKSVEVTTGRSDIQYTEILSGLEVDDLIVTSAQFLLDSESSKSSDFRRMNHAADGNDDEGASHD